MYVYAQQLFAAKAAPTLVIDNKFFLRLCVSTVKDIKKQTLNRVELGLSMKFVCEWLLNMLE